jgi:hypothetical protein
MAIPHHMYLIMNMLAPNGILSIYNDIMVSYRCEDETLDLASTSAYAATALVMVAQDVKTDVTTLELPEQKHMPTTLDASPMVKKVCLGLPDAAKEVTIGSDLDPK